VLVPGVDALEPGFGRLFVVVGVFDGLHRGHAYLLRHLVRGAAARGARPTVITFDHHPDEVLTGAAPPLLLDPDERLARLATAGVEVTVVEHFDDELRRTTYDAFVGRIAARVDLAGFLLTPDAAFGHERRGTPEALAELGRASGPAFDVEVVRPFALPDRAVRSSDVRAAIAAGDLATARRILGRAHAVVAPGTAVDAMPIALPPPGRYAARVGRPWSPGWHGRATEVEVDGLGVDGLGRSGARRRVAFIERLG
jgi:riboflavin kinase/FMN adenylyltransferase